MGEDQSVALATPDVPMSEFAPSITVVEKGKKFQVAVSAAANRMSWQITTSKFRALLEDYIDKMKETGEVPDIATLKKLAEIAVMTQEMSMKAFEGAKKTKDSDSSEFERYAHGAVRAAAEGIAKGMSSAANEKEAEIKRLGKKQPAVDIDAKKVEEAAVPAGTP